jgi:hypothetical protein
MLFLLAVGVVAFVQPVSVTCGSSTVTQSQAVRGPEGVTAVLKVSTEDDHAKNTHLCMADYKLAITRNSDKPHETDLLSSDNDWGRKISVQLGGFSHDGKQVIGMFSEGGSAPVKVVFDYNTSDDSTRLFDLRKLAAGLKPEKCLVNAQIMGTLESGAIVIQLRSRKDCVRSSQWSLNSVNGPMHHIPKHAAVLQLYSASAAH